VGFPAGAARHPVLPVHLQDLIDQGLRLRQRGYRGRFAPSPTGSLHRGNLRTALISWLDARLAGGEWILRIDDLDTSRNRPGAEASILEDLDWLGLDWEGPIIRQSQRRGTYASVLSWLRRAGLLYPCRCSRRLLADISAPHGLWSVYPGFCRERAQSWGWSEGRLPSWRLKLPAGQIQWAERFGPPGRLEGRSRVGDVVLRRADGLVAYHLATAVDELLLGISDVVRGLDLWSSTASQVAVIDALGETSPRYGHIPLWCEADGRRLSKRSAAEGLMAYQQGGMDAAAVVGALASSVGLVPEGSRLSARELLASVHRRDLDRCLGPAPADQPAGRQT
jgi:glutamyl-tRNA synthetase